MLLSKKTDTNDISSFSDVGFLFFFPLLHFILKQKNQHNNSSNRTNTCKCHLGHWERSLLLFSTIFVGSNQQFSNFSYNAFRGRKLFIRHCVTFRNRQSDVNTSCAELIDSNASHELVMSDPHHVLPLGVKLLVLCAAWNHGL